MTPMRDVDMLEPVLAYLRVCPGSVVRRVAQDVFGEQHGATGRTRLYMAAYRCLRILEAQGAVVRERVPSTDRRHPGPVGHPVAMDVWSAVDGATVPTVPVHEPASDPRHDGLDPNQRRTYWLTERMHFVLVGVLNDACAEAPEDVELRKLCNIVKAATISHATPGRTG